jgi:hypothetical protein
MLVLFSWQGWQSLVITFEDEDEAEIEKIRALLAEDEDAQDDQGSSVC